MIIKLGKQLWINTQYIESICIAGKNVVSVFMINSDVPYQYGFYDTYGEAINAVNELVERINKEKD